MTRAIIIDDEALARSVIKNYLKNNQDVEVVSECANGFEGLKAIQDEKPDLVFLDIQMPKLSGFELLELLDEPPVIIFSTAFDEYALRAFEMSAADYLLKPYTRQRFEEAVNKALARIRDTGDNYSRIIETVKSEARPIDRIAVRNGSRIT
ncbi:MAG: response regulator, partial [Cyclobacteriaceae bacterium]